MPKTYNEIISVINDELEEEHKHAMKKVRTLIVKKEQHKSVLSYRLHELTERFKRLEGILPELNAEIARLEQANRQSLAMKKGNERKQVAVKKKLEELQKQLKGLIDTHTLLIDEMNERNKKENELINRTDRILFFKKQLLRLMQKTKSEMVKSEKQLALLGREEDQLEKSNMPEIKSAAAIAAPLDKVPKQPARTVHLKSHADHPHVRIEKRKGKAVIIKRKDDSPKVEVHKKTITFNPKSGVKVHIKVKK